MARSRRVLDADYLGGKPPEVISRTGDKPGSAAEDNDVDEGPFAVGPRQGVAFNADPILLTNDGADAVSEFIPTGPSEDQDGVVAYGNQPEVTMLGESVDEIDDAPFGYRPRDESVGDPNANRVATDGGSPAEDFQDELGTYITLDAVTGGDNPTDEVVTLDYSPGADGGTFAIRYKTHRSGDIDFDEDAAVVQAICEVIFGAEDAPSVAEHGSNDGFEFTFENGALAGRPILGVVDFALEDDSVTDGGIVEGSTFTATTPGDYGTVEVTFSTDSVGALISVVNDATGEEVGRYVSDGTTDDADDDSPVTIEGKFVPGDYTVVARAVGSTDDADHFGGRVGPATTLGVTLPQEVSA